LAGKVVGVDPGHNGKNYTDPTFLNKQIFNGVNYEGCDTTGTETDSGYSEAQFNFNVATYLRSDLEADGATVVMTRTSNTGVGPCVTTRAQILNNAGADVAVDIHADGGPTTGRGFAVLEPVADGPNDAIVGPSESLGALVVSHFLTTGIPTSNYDGTNGVDFRNNLAGLNLATEPKILIECGNMKNPIDAALLVTPAFQQSAAAALAQAVIAFLTTNS
jgi:N-acetylmuramoyl-L-alanine amidase